MSFFVFLLAVLFGCFIVAAVLAIALELID